ncbi:adenosylcobinamide amidohydrolase [Rubricella aquisinus]|uniref:Adenosylcobinamide amidohydrolase n=1 Tax=Rubricella aquisinus TaxID=2028108 RepID=A0A840WRK5_9RHOB|nr:adenosylcobinamide amidohydrolase [Rubricella aquisinus]MBB5516302.1 adenosylcobinamide amidohydrolase [Rubricella aquisinus]
MRITLTPPWLIADLATPHKMASWALSHPGITRAQRVAWRQVRNADLPQELDVTDWFTKELSTQGDPVGLLTSRDIRHHHHTTVTIEGHRVEALATVGLSNAEEIGTRSPRAPFPGTINILVQSHTPMTEAALLEAMSLIAAARTVEVLAADHPLPGGRRATGTGTDCIVIAAPDAPDPTPYAGMHTALGEAIGAATRQVMRAGVTLWTEQHRAGQIKPLQPTGETDP